MEVISLEKAKELNLKTYFTGIPCKNGHLSPRKTKGYNCLECLKEANKIYRNKAEIKNHYKEWREKHKEEHKLYCKERYEENKDIILAKQKEYYGKNFDKISKKSKIYAEKNKDKILEYHKEYRIKNKEEIKEKQKIYREQNVEKLAKNRKINKKKNPNYELNRIYGNISTQLRKVIKGERKSKKQEFLIGYKTLELKEHLEKLFKPEMNWKNYGSYWHIDHIRPVSWFKMENYNSKEELIKDCWRLENLQPLEAKINLSKNNRFEG